MSSLIGQGGRALVLRLVLAEILAKRGQGPLAPRFTLLARGTVRVRPATESTSTPAGKERA